jgi:hypothetical protein
MTGVRRFIPSFEEGVAAPIKEWNATLDSAQPGRFEPLLQEGPDLPAAPCLR